MTAQDSPIVRAAAIGDTAQVRQLLAAASPPPGPERQEALYAALKNGQRDAAFLLVDGLVEDNLVAEQTFPPHQLQERKKDIVDGIFVAVDAKHAVALTAVSMLYGLDGLFRLLCETEPQTMASFGPVIVAALGRLDYVIPLLDIGAQTDHMRDRIFPDAIVAGRVDIVSRLIDAGVSPNHVALAPHPLALTEEIEDDTLREKMISLLISRGSDIRLYDCAALSIMLENGANPARAQCLLDRFEPGSSLPALLAARIESTNLGPRGQVPANFPILRPLYMRGLVAPLFGPGLQDRNWCNEIAALPDINEDDALLLKLAVVAPQAVAVVQFLTGLGANPNPAKDPPLRLALLLGKRHVFRPLIDAGADVFADDAALFRLARDLRKDDEAAILRQLAANTETRRAREFRAERGHDISALSPESLRQGDGLGRLARAGLFGDAAAAGVLFGLTAEDFLRKDSAGTRLASILAAQQRFDLLFSPAVWGQDAAGAQRVREVLDAPDQAAAQSAFENLRNHQRVDENHRQLKAQATKPRLKGFRPGG